MRQETSQRCTHPASAGVSVQVLSLQADLSSLSAGEYESGSNGTTAPVGDPVVDIGVESSISQSDFGEFESVNQLYDDLAERTSRSPSAEEERVLETSSCGGVGWSLCAGLG